MGSVRTAEGELVVLPELCGTSLWHGCRRDQGARREARGGAFEQTCCGGRHRQGLPCRELPRAGRRAKSSIRWFWQARKADPRALPRHASSCCACRVGDAGRQAGRSRDATRPHRAGIGRRAGGAGAGAACTGPCEQTFWRPRLARRRCSRSSRSALYAVEDPPNGRADFLPYAAAKLNQFWLVSGGRRAGQHTAAGIYGPEPVVSTPTLTAAAGEHAIRHRTSGAGGGNLDQPEPADRRPAGALVRPSRPARRQWLPKAPGGATASERWRVSPSGRTEIHSKARV